MEKCKGCNGTEQIISVVPDMYGNPHERYTRCSCTEDEIQEDTTSMEEKLEALAEMRWEDKQD